MQIISGSARVVVNDLVATGHTKVELDADEVVVDASANGLTINTPSSNTTINSPLVILTDTGDADLRVKGGLYVGDTGTDPVAGHITATTCLNVGVGTGNRYVDIYGGVEKNRGLRYFTGSSQRWAFRANNAAEGGSNAGSNFTIHRYADNGSWLAQALTINRATGLVGIAVSNPAAQLHVDQPSTTAAIPVLCLDQADVSEEMIEFASTIGVGNAIEAAAGKTLTATHFIKVTLPGSLTRYIPVGTIA